MKNNNAKGKSRLGKFSLLTLIAIYFLILVGGIVRTTGSGMGCPDWPKCFGSWVPPTEVSQLPADYKEVYSQKRQKKNVKLIGYLQALGFEETADKIASDKSILEEDDFNATKTWIEYINRLIGVLIGLFVIGTLYLSLKFRKSEPLLFYLALTAFALVVFQGWIGSLVVSTNLIPFMVTFHMLLALVIVAVLCVIVVRANSDLRIVKADVKQIKWVLIISMVLMLLQVVFGTQVREAVDIVALTLTRNEWIENLGLTFFIHRSFSWIILVSNGYLIYLLWKKSALNTTSKMLISVILITVFSGTIMAYFDIPAFIQPIHLLLGTLGFGLQFFLFLQLKSEGKVTV